MSRQAGPRHGVQDSRPGGDQTAQGSLLSERRDAEFEQKMAEVLCVYREVQVLKKAAAKSRKAIKRVAVVSYDEKPGIQALATTGRRICRPNPASTRPLHGITSTNAMAR